MIYLVANKYEDCCKIGYSINPEARLLQLQTSSPHPLELMSILDGDKVKEKEVHELFKEYRLMGEWFEYHDVIKKYFKVEDYVKLYPSGLSLILGLPGACLNLFFVLFEYIKCGTNEIFIDNSLRKELSSIIGIKLNTINNSIPLLCNRGILYKTAINVYVMNPYIVFNGSDYHRVRLINKYKFIE